MMLHEELILHKLRTGVNVDSDTLMLFFETQRKQLLAREDEIERLTRELSREGFEWQECVAELKAKVAKLEAKLEKETQ